MSSSACQNSLCISLRSSQGVSSSSVSFSFALEPLVQMGRKCGDDEITGIYGGSFRDERCVHIGRSDEIHFILNPCDAPFV